MKKSLLNVSLGVMVSISLLSGFFHGTEKDNVSNNILVTGKVVEIEDSESERHLFDIMKSLKIIVNKKIESQKNIVK